MSASHAMHAVLAVPGADSGLPVAASRLAGARDLSSLAAALGALVEERFGPRGVAVHLEVEGDLRALYARGPRSPGSGRTVLAALERRGQVLGAVELYAPRVWGGERRGWLDSVCALAACEVERIAAECRALVLGHARDERELYVPATLRAALEGGRAVTGSLPSVTVLFVDLRAYVSWSASRSDAEVFALLDRYVLGTSDVIHQHGGWVVDLDGDAVMAAFGAPTPRAGKERAALRAARGIAKIAPRVVAAEGSGPSFGIGIATGTGFGGFLRSVDRCVWSVVGDATNRAARLQQLARDRGLEIVLDDATRCAAGVDADDLESMGPIPLRGIPDPVVAWSAPVSHEPATPAPVIGCKRDT